MPRRPRLCIADTPLHIVQRGVNRQDCFREALDYRAYLAALLETSTRYDVAVHAYVLMTNHVHLLVSPTNDFGASRMMQQLGRKYVSYFNKAYQRTGTLWEGRFRSSMIDSSHYLFACYRYIELNPIRAGLVTAPEQYKWSSYRSNALGYSHENVTAHHDYMLLAEDRMDRCRLYRRLFAGTHDDADEAIRTACRKGVRLP
jgi:putative transposase